MERLESYHPLLAGTVPLDLQVQGSDLDILCEVYDSVRFTAEVRQAFGGFSGFRTVTRTVEGISRTKINFEAGGWPVELFGQPVPVERQNGFRHMLVEWEILRILGGEFREAVIALKRRGVKTEPAFAGLLRLPGEPYAAILALEELPAAELEALCHKAYPPNTDNKCTESYNI